MGESRSVYEAAKKWWRSRRPLIWDEATHLDTPAINCPMEVEKELAKQVARAVRGERRKERARG